MKMKMRKGLLVRLGGLGDLLTAVPAMQFLRRRFPETRFTLVSREDYGEFLRRLGIAHLVRRWDSPELAPLFSSSCPKEGEAAVWVREFDLIVAWRVGRESDSLTENLIALAGPEKCRIFHYRPEGGDSIGRHFFDRTVDAFRLEGPSTKGLSLEECALLPVGDVQKSNGLRLIQGGEPGKTLLLIHPGSGGKAKIWPLSRYLEILRRLGDRGFRGAVVTGDAESDMDRFFRDRILPAGWVRLKNPSLDALAGLLSVSRLYIGNDSGITHLAAACGAEVIALFLDRHVAAWRPLGRVRLLSAPSIDAIPVESVWRVIAKALEIPA